MEINSDMAVSFQGAATAQKGVSLDSFPRLRLMHRWSFGWIVESNEDAIFSAQGAYTAQNGSSIEIFFDWG